MQFGVTRSIKSRIIVWRWSPGCLLFASDDCISYRLSSTLQWWCKQTNQYPTYLHNIYTLSHIIKLGVASVSRYINVLLFQHPGSLCHAVSRVTCDSHNCMEIRSAAAAAVLPGPSIYHFRRHHPHLRPGAGTHCSFMATLFVDHCNEQWVLQQLLYPMYQVTQELFKDCMSWDELIIASTE